MSISRATNGLPPVARLFLETAGVVARRLQANSMRPPRSLPAGPMTSPGSVRQTDRRSRAGALTSLLLLGACAGSGEHATGPQPLLAASRPASVAPTLSPEQGARLWSGLCRSCHGDAGKGDTALARDLQPNPADLTRCNFKLRSTPSGSLPVDDDLLRTLYIGLPGSAMPAFAELLPLPALRALVREAKQRCDRFGRELPEEPLAIGRPELYDAASVERGQRVYAREKCASCHGDAGRGDGPSSRALKDVGGRLVRPRDYSAGIFRGGFGRRDIYRAFSTGLDGTPMPALADSIPVADRWDLTHFIVSLSHRRSQLLRALEQPPTWVEPARAGGLPWR
jgi:mono/diheme cytochrome c family protein